MTVIAWDGKTLAADKRMTAGGMISTVRKLDRVGDCLVGYCGSGMRIGEFRAWLLAGRDPATYPPNPDEDSLFMLVVHRSGLIERFERRPYPLVIEDAMHAEGSGRDFAVAAMHLGCTAEQAVAVACLFAPSCGNGIDTLTFEAP